MRNFLVATQRIVLSKRDTARVLKLLLHPPEAHGRPADGSSPSCAIGYIMNEETKFPQACAQTAAAEAISGHKLFKLTLEDQRVFVNALLNPPAPARALKDAATRYRGVIAP